MTCSLYASSSHNGLSVNFLALAACTLLLQCLQSTSTYYTNCRDCVPLHLRLLQQWGPLAVAAYWLCLPAAVAITIVIGLLSNCK